MPQRPARRSRQRRIQMNDRTHDDHPDSIRRRLLQAGAGAAALGTLPGTGILDAAAQPAFDWKRFKGEKIEVFHVKSPRGDLLTKSSQGVRGSHRHHGRFGVESRAAATAKGGHRVQLGQHELRRDRICVCRAEAAARQEQLAGGRAAPGRGQVGDGARRSRSPTSPRAGWSGPRSRMAESTASRSTSIRGCCTTTRNCSTPGAWPIPRISPRSSMRQRS